MLILHGPVKVDLIFSDEPHTHEPPWEPDRANLDAIDAHFWDWTLWLRGKEVGGKTELVTSELDKLFGYLLAPLGVTRPPSSLGDALSSYRKARERAENEFGVVVGRHVESAVAPAFQS